MLQEERFIRIQSLLESFERVTTERLTRDLQVSRETVRQDLLELESLGLVRRVHGGAVGMKEKEPPFRLRQARHIREKRAIAKAAVKLLSPGQMLFIDAGSTTAILAEELALLTGLTLVTNSIPIAMRLSHSSQARSRGASRVILLGGQVNPDLPCTYGSSALNELRHYRADMAMISPVGITAHSGSTSFDEQECHIARAMAEQAEKLVILADHSKIGVESRYVTARPERIDYLVTNPPGCDTAALQPFHDTNIKLVLA